MIASPTRKWRFSTRGELVSVSDLGGKDCLIDLHLCFSDKWWLPHLRQHPHFLRDSMSFVGFHKDLKISDILQISVESSVFGVVKTQTSPYKRGAYTTHLFLEIMLCHEFRNQSTNQPIRMTTLNLISQTPGKPGFSLGWSSLVKL